MGKRKKTKSEVMGSMVGGQGVSVSNAIMDGQINISSFTRKNTEIKKKKKKREESSPSLVLPS